MFEELKTGYSSSGLSYSWSVRYIASLTFVDKYSVFYRNFKASFKTKFFSTQNPYSAKHDSILYLFLKSPKLFIKMSLTVFTYTEFNEIENIIQNSLLFKTFINFLNCKEKEYAHLKECIVNILQDKGLPENTILPPI